MGGAVTFQKVSLTLVATLPPARTARHHPAQAVQVWKRGGLTLHVGDCGQQLAKHLFV